MLHAFEQTLLSVLDVDGRPFFAKGANFKTRARIVTEKMYDRVTYSLDMSSFDNSIRGGIYRGEIRAFGTLFGYAFDEEMFLKPLLARSQQPDDVVEDLPVRKSGDV